jgi:hypothetical protein
VVRHSVRRIDVVAGAVMPMTGLGCFGIGPIRFAHLIAPLLGLAALLVAASTRSIITAVRPRSFRSTGGML